MSMFCFRSVPVIFYRVSAAISCPHQSRNSYEIESSGWRPGPSLGFRSCPSLSAHPKWDKMVWNGPEWDKIVWNGPK